MPGFITMYWDAKAGKIWLEVDRWDAEFLYVNSLPAGVGSNDIGLDRGQIGINHIVKFYRSGPKVLLVAPNYAYRALSGDPAERRTVEESFAQSVLWGFTVAAEEGNKALLDATDFFLHDNHNIPLALKDTKQGNFRLEPSRSAIYLPATKNFPQNTEVEAILTFISEEMPGDFARQVVPSPQHITVRERHSFVQLPEPGYRPREFDPRSGFFDFAFMDYATPVDQPVRIRWIARHRLQKKDPSASVSEAVEPIVYYIDNGAPEPIRSALLEGASWWNQAFEAAGYRNAFQVKLLPADADPMDVRYNTIQWVHRATRGWSYGNAVVDPRTGEIIKGHVTLGSLRVRQDYLIAEGLLAPYEEGKQVPPDMMKMALARIRQLSAHEVGHTLGLSHNYIASAADRASVMDYPQPLVKIREDGTLDLSDAYRDRIGEWDKISIRYGYSDFPKEADERKELYAILKDGIDRGLIFISDQDARPQGSAHPEAHLWDNGFDAFEELEHILKVRKLALQRFGERNIRKDFPLATLEETLVPIYLYHRYQIQAIAKVLGGLKYTYALRGDGQTPTEIVSPAQQRAALNALLNTLTPEVLALPENLLRIIPPHPIGYDRTREVFSLHTGMTFDPLAAAETSADMTITMLLNPERAARLIEYHARDRQNPGFDEVLENLVAATWKTSHGAGYDAAIRRMVDSVVLERLLSLAANEHASSQVRAIASLHLESLRVWLSKQLPLQKDNEQKAHLFFAASQIRQFQEDPKRPIRTPPPEPPAGPPIGDM